jgi:parvulin-like peptidyl-prolyl isomerase
MLFVGIALGSALSPRAWAQQDILDAPPPDIAPAAIAPPATAPVAASDAANLAGCQVIARVDDQIILACDVLWRVNLLLEGFQQRMPAGEQMKADKMQAAQRELLKNEVARLVDRKLLYNDFRRTVPAENLPRIEDNLRQPFEERELPSLYKRLNVDNKRDLEKELARLGSSLADAQRAFNEQVIAGEWLRSKIKVNEDVSPDELIEYYRAHLAEYDYPSQARWEELVVRKNRFKDPSKAFAELAKMGNEVWQNGTKQPVRGAAFAEVAKKKSDGFTAKDGGLRDWTTKGALSCKEIDDALFTLQVGQMSSIIDDGTTFIIVRVLERKDAGRKPFTDVQGDIRDRLKEQRFQAEAMKYVAKLRKDARIWTVFTGNVSADVLLGRQPDETQKK